MKSDKYYTGRSTKLTLTQFLLDAFTSSRDGTAHGYYACATNSKGQPGIPSSPSITYLTYIHTYIHTQQIGFLFSVIRSNIVVRTIL